MQALALASQPLGCRELARSLDLNPMRANRLLKTLADIGLAQQDDKKRYAIGPGIHALAAQSMFGSGLLRRALPLLKDLDRQRFAGLTVAIGVLWRDQVTYIFHGNLDNDLDQGIGRVNLHPASQSSIGMILLAQQSDEILNYLYPQDCPGYKQKSDFMAAINKARQLSYAAIKSESAVPHFSLAVPVATQSSADAKPTIALAFSGIDIQADLDPFVHELQLIASRMSL